jgi:homoserine dehydrogenase
MFGKGAGAHPTGSAVLSDITARLHNYRYEYKKQKYFNVPKYSTNHTLSVYLRFTNPSDLNLFNFEQIQERYTSEQNNYVIGTIKLDQLIKLKSTLPKRDLFLAYLGDLVNTY